MNRTLSRILWIIAGVLLIIAGVLCLASPGVAVESLALYTAAGYKISFGISCAMAVLTLAALVYTVLVWLLGEPVTGWTTTMLVLSGGLAGLFVILTIAIKYLSLLVGLVFRKQDYLIEGIEKLQR